MISHETMQSQERPLRRDTSTIRDVERMVKEATTYLRRRRASAAQKSGHASKACQARWMLPRILLGEGRPVVLGRELVEDAAMHIVDVEGRADLAGHAFQRPATILVGDRGPVRNDAAPCASSRESGGNS